MNNLVVLWFSKMHDWILQEKARASEPLNSLLMAGNYRRVGQESMEVRHGLLSPMAQLRRENLAKGHLFTIEYVYHSVA